jgi:hypothetical protein
MPSLLRPRPNSRIAASVLGEVFKELRHPLAFRLWDGTEVRLGEGEPACVVVIHAPETFTALIRDPSPGHFAEAYASNAIDIQGNLFDAMRVANEVEEIKVTTGQRLRILLALWKKA